MKLIQVFILLKHLQLIHHHLKAVVIIVIAIAMVDIAIVTPMIVHHIIHHMIQTLNRGIFV